MTSFFLPDRPPPPPPPANTQLPSFKQSRICITQTAVVLQSCAKKAREPRIVSSTLWLTLHCLLCMTVGRRAFSNVCPYLVRITTKGWAVPKCVNQTSVILLKSVSVSTKPQNLILAWLPEAGHLKSVPPTHQLQYNTMQYALFGSTRLCSLIDWFQRCCVLFLCMLKWMPESYLVQQTRVKTLDREKRAHRFSDEWSIAHKRTCETWLWTDRFVLHLRCILSWNTCRRLRSGAAFVWLLPRVIPTWTEDKKTKSKTREISLKPCNECQCWFSAKW